MSVYPESLWVDYLYTLFNVAYAAYFPFSTLHAIGQFDEPGSILS